MAERTASDVIAVFTGLGLPVCDDAQAITQKVNAQKGKYLNDKKKPDPAVVHRAELWFKDVTDLQYKLADQLAVVYRAYVESARVALAAAGAAGVHTMTGALQQALVQLAYRQFKTCDGLATRFFTDLCRDEKLPPLAGPLVPPPAPVRQFAADSRAGEVVLRWEPPADRCDAVEILREEEAAPGTPRTVHRSRDERTFVDRDVRPGVWYRYRARARVGDTEGQESVARAVCVGEAGRVAGAWKDGAVRLSWELPGAAAAAVVFRRAGAAPQLRDTPDGPEPAGPDTVEFNCGSVRTFADPNVTEGTTYHYRVVADFGWGAAGKGVDVQVLVPKPPPPVARLTAATVLDRGAAVVSLKWDAVPGAAEYVVVRRDGGAAPDGLAGGTEVARTPQCECLDSGVEPGRRYTYAVFAWAAGRPSRTGTAAPPVDVLAEVADLAADTGDRAVQLTWTPPAHVVRVVVRRGLSEPAHAADGQPVPTVGLDHAHDDGLRNGLQYHYLVCCVYRPDGATDVFSPGARVAAVPDPPPEPPTGFAAVADGAGVVCTWDAPPAGTPVVRRTAHDPGLPPGRRLSAADVNKLGDAVVVSESRAADPTPDARTPYYTVFAVAGGRAVAGGTAACVTCADVSDLRLAATETGVVLRWSWPDAASAVRVVCRVGEPPTGPDDPAATRSTCTRTDYLAAGDRFADRVPGSGRYHYAVFAQPAGAPGVFFAPGTGPGCRAVIQWEPRMTVRYRLTLDDDALTVTGEVDQPFAGFAGLLLVANQERVPEDAADGVELDRWTPSSADFERRVSLEPVRRKRWGQAFCRVIVADPVQRYATLIVHPDLSVPATDPPRPAPRAAERVYRPGRPATVICPSCFAEFSPLEMLYGDYSGAKPVPARRAWWERLLGRPPRLPRNAKGQVLSKKHCPHGHELPFTAGAQANLVLGLIGAKYVGKSHFVAALVRQLEERAGADLRASLLPVTDETPKRYRSEFYDPLFKNRFELPLTVGAPAPLIYDLTLDGRVWNEKENRAVTLALYDTAGENFADPATVRQMVKYVAVASGLMVLIDPMQLPGVREALPGGTKLPDAEDPNAVITRVLRELEGGQLLVENARFRTPVAVVLTKCDVLRDAGLMEPDRVWASDARHVGHFHRDLHADMSGMVAACVQKWCPAVYQTVARRFERFAFFAASATGCGSDARTKRYRYIAPWRVEDPLLWLLAETGVIPTR